MFAFSAVRDSHGDIIDDNTCDSFRDCGVDYQDVQREESYD